MGKDEKRYVQREYKDTVFRMLFGKKKNRCMRAEC